MSFDLYAGLFYGFITIGIPWQTASDFDPSEYPEARYFRLLASKDNSAIVIPARSRCDVGYSFCENYGKPIPHWVYVISSLSRSHGTFEAKPLSDIKINPAWNYQLNLYCELMSIPKQKPSWCLATTMS